MARLLTAEDNLWVGPLCPPCGSWGQGSGYQEWLQLSHTEWACQPELSLPPSFHKGHRKTVVSFQEKNSLCFFEEISSIEHLCN